MAGGNWTAQNKVRPGVYINFSTQGGQTLSQGERGVLAGPKALSWGPMGKIMTIHGDESLLPHIGYDITAPQALFLREALKGTDVSGPPTQILLYRLPAADAAAASAPLSAGEDAVTATARYPGVRGNDISIAVAEDVDSPGMFSVTTLVDGVQRDRQQAADASGLTPNDWVSFSAAGVLAATAGVRLTGGTDGTVDPSAYASFLEAVEPYRFDVLAYDGTERTVREAYISFVQRLAAQNGRYAQLVAAGAEGANSRFVISCKSGVVLSDGTELTPQETVWWLAGAEAGASYSQALSCAAYPGAVDISPRLTSAQIEEAILSGSLVLSEEFGKVRIETDINTMTTFTPELGEVFHKNRSMRACSTLANDLYREFTLNFQGKVNNNEEGRNLFKASILDYLQGMYSKGALRQRPVGDDVTVRMGSSVDSIVIELAVWLADAVEKIYITITVA